MVRRKQKIVNIDFPKVLIISPPKSMRLLPKSNSMRVQPKPDTLGLNTRRKRR
jgi:hypothetical protein